jgi:hypothetical protein
MSHDELAPGVRISEAFAKVAVTYTEAFPHFRIYARHSIDHAPPLTSDSVVHDNASGPGAVSTAIIAQFEKKSEKVPKLITTDANPAMVAQAKKENPGLDARVMDSTSLELEDGSITHSFTNFLLSPLFPKGKNVDIAKNVRKTIAPGGTATFACWCYLEWLVMLRDAANAVRPGGEEFVPNHDYSEDVIRETLVEGGFATENLSFVRHESLGDAFTPGPSKDQMTLVGGLMGGMVTATWSDEEKELFKSKLQAELDRAVEEGTRYKMAAMVVTAKC